MLYLKYFLMIILGWIGSLIIGALLGVIFGSHKSKFGGFISGIINPFITVFIIGKILVDKNVSNTYDILPICLILLPLTLIMLQALYNSGVQDGRKNDILPISGIRMKLNKGLIFGTLIGCITTLFLFTRYLF